jgi:hypothetical protein
LINETINPQIKVHDYLELLVNEINLWSEDRNKCIHMMAKLDFDVNKDIKARLVAIKECAIKGYHLWTLIRNITSYLMKKDIFKYIEQKAIINTTTVTGVAASLISASTSTL